MKKELRGTGVALVTPLLEDYSIDYSALSRLLDHIISGNVDYVVVLGTTGESPVFSWKEKLEILRFIMDQVADRKPVVFGLGGNHTLDLVEKIQDLKNVDLAAILSVSPYYSNPSQRGIIRHYELLADESPHPIILYNVPSRTASNVTAETTLLLAKHPNIIGVKEASGDLSQCEHIAKKRPADFMLLSGDDASALDLIKLGGEGVISVIGNIVPLLFTQMINKALEGDFNEASRLNEQLSPGYRLTVEEGNPASLKVGFEALGMCKRTVKPPLYDASDKLLEKWQCYLNKG